jgi:hypothetical protein
VLSAWVANGVAARIIVASAQRSIADLFCIEHPRATVTAVAVRSEALFGPWRNTMNDKADQLSSAGSFSFKKVPGVYEHSGDSV